MALVVEQTQKKGRRLRRASLYQGSCIDCFPLHSFKLFRAFVQISLCPPPPFPIHGDRLLVSGVPFLRPYPNFFGACGGLCVLVAMARIIMMKITTIIIIIMMMVLIMSFIASYCRYWGTKVTQSFEEKTAQRNTRYRRIFRPKNFSAKQLVVQCF